MVQVAQIGGRGGGGGEFGEMPKRKHLFFQEGFPKLLQVVTNYMVLATLLVVSHSSLESAVKWVQDLPELVEVNFERN